MYFVGVTTGQSSINQVFPLWAERLRLGDCELRGIDLPLHAAPERYRAAVEFIKRDPLSLGALVTTHKVDLYRACRDQFDKVEAFSDSLGEISSICKRAGRLHGRTVDPWTSGYALDAFLPRSRWKKGAEILILGAGGAGSALAWHLCCAWQQVGASVCVRVLDRRAARLEHLSELHGTWRGAAPLECHEATNAEQTDRFVSHLAPGSLVVNATGMGKDVPGSPLTDAALFPEDGFVWEFNYRGELVFLEQARAQQKSRHLHLEDGWTYFLHGWTRVIADVFDREIPTHGPWFEELGLLATRSR